jgi:outer membrane protein OmpA-like peptidoglycan-associated protein
LFKTTELIMPKTTRYLPFIFLLLCFAIGSKTVSCQNLVQNPSFEQLTYCPNLLGEAQAATYWINPQFHKKQISVLHSCANQTHLATSLTHNELTQLMPKYGEGMLAIRPQPLKNSYLRNTLKSEPLQGQTYCLNLWIAFPDSTKKLPTLKAYLIEPYNQLHPIDSILKLREAQPLQLFDEFTVVAPNKWLQLSTSLIAKSGKERYLILVNDVETEGANRYNLPSIILLDNLCLTHVKTNPTCECRNFEKPTIGKTELLIKDLELNRPPINQEIVLPNVLFQHNSHKLLPISQHTLDSVAAIFTKYPEYHIEIIGHTDSDGDDNANLNLSAARALAVLNYLTLEKKLNPNKFKAIGKGEQAPLLPNTSNENKKINRRVSFKLITTN